MITEDYVSFETAKLLKEKGFKGVGSDFYENEKIISFDNFWWRITPTQRYEAIEAPTFQMAMKWLRKKHNILLVVDYEYECDTTPYYFKIYRLGENGKPERVPIKGVSYDKNDNATEHIVGYRDWERSKGDYSTYEEAAEAAIKYCLENLI